MSQAILKPLPLSQAHLERFRLRTRRQHRATMVGGHQMRRKGQSLEFYDYRQYTPGDDVRHIDWRASARHGGRDELLIKNFAAEEHMALVISIDTRPSMFLPDAMSKLQVAAWIAEAVARITLRSADKVVLHRLFGKRNGSVDVLRGSGAMDRIRSTLERFARDSMPPETSGKQPAAPDEIEKVNLDGLSRHLPPSAVWLVISDFYFDMETEAKKLANRLIHAQDGWRWVITMDLDSWQWEKEVLGTGGRKIEGPGLGPLDARYQIDDHAIREIEKRIGAHKTQFRQLVTRDSYDALHWQWPAAHSEPGAFFQHRFGDSQVLQRLFMKGNA